MREINFYPLIKRWLEKNRPASFWFFEIKLVKTKSFSLKSVSERQSGWLLEALTGKYYKITDTAAKSGFTQPKPCDGFWTGKNRVNCFIIPIFYVSRKKKTAHLIPIQEFVKFTGTSIKEEELKRFEFIEL